MNRRRRQHRGGRRGRHRRRHPVGRHVHGGQQAVQLLGDLVADVEFVDVQRDLAAVQHQVHAAAFGDLADHADQRGLHLVDGELRRLLDDAVAVAEAALGGGDTFLQLALAGADLVGRQLGAVAGQRLLHVAPDQLLLLGVFVQLLAALADGPVGVLGGERGAHHLGQADHADNRGRRCSTLGQGGQLGHRGHRDLADRCLIQIGASLVRARLLGGLRAGGGRRGAATLGRWGSGGALLLLAWHEEVLPLGQGRAARNTV